ncbi:hypothetical protein AB205_0151640 [Aquarana catesbeiana]|uniref:Uncharacterized protein n=1 Tax=Aquarana catesbeiana TaxID=8400 RepID=A0A2G9SIR5_AQUCT|nr:hypothetical protein AB205_0151640 [Aquarana catesbeiana]
MLFFYYKNSVKIKGKINKKNVFFLKCALSRSHAEANAYVSSTRIWKRC